ncbi:E3 ubiquitin-protein ligase TRIM56-like [Pomacea canaliculata]|uniref:E3 ubiquitin-protein ligase TRIM56-like n=1 Tax=Pomacea canaliculata TaxID=400727 RepID=UPI000D734FF6|nr:E3 ubiquitin-protein ligase TRIM56-like [Pomacea canaliculata]
MDYDIPESRHQECPLCLERFKSPRILPCFHTFCLQCLSRLIETQSSRSSFPCPTCRTRVKIPSGGAAKFQVNFYIENDSRGRLHASEGACVCGECRDATSTQVCDDCNQLLCDLCTDLHVSAPDSKCRTSSRMQASPQDPASNQRSCVQHPQEKYRFFCQPCRVPLCRDCKLTSHEGHATCDLRQVAACQGVLPGRAAGR